MWRCVIILHTCDINVVLNAMVKVNQAAILLASPGQPCHQPIKQQHLPIPKYLHQGKQMEKFKSKTRINPSSLPGSSPVAPCWRASKASRESVSKLSKGEGRANIHTAVLLSVSRRLLLAWYCTPQWSLRCALVLVLNLGASVCHGCSPLVLLLVNEG